MDKSSVWLATALLRGSVRNSAGENLGTLEDVVIDPDTGNVRYGIVSFNGARASGNRLFAIPWGAFDVFRSSNFVVLNADEGLLASAPSFDRGSWPDMTDAAWRKSIDDHYARMGTRRVVVPEPRPYYYSERPAKRRGMSTAATIFLIVVLVIVGWAAFLVATRGWDQARTDIRDSVQGAAYAAKETTHDAALTTRVKTALSLSRRIPAGKINVDSDGDIVTLRGEVPSSQVRDLAESITRDVPGVRDVHNHLFPVSPGQ